MSRLCIDSTGSISKSLFCQSSYVILLLLVKEELKMLLLCCRKFEGSFSLLINCFCTDRHSVEMETLYRSSEYLCPT